MYDIYSIFSYLILQCNGYAIKELKPDRKICRSYRWFENMISSSIKDFGTN